MRHTVEMHCIQRETQRKIVNIRKTARTPSILSLSSTEIHIEYHCKESDSARACACMLRRSHAMVATQQMYTHTNTQRRARESSQTRIRTVYRMFLLTFLHKQIWISCFQVFNQFDRAFVSNWIFMRVLCCNNTGDVWYLNLVTMT